MWWYGLEMECVCVCVSWRKYHVHYYDEFRINVIAFRDLGNMFYMHILRVHSL